MAGSQWKVPESSRCTHPPGAGGPNAVKGWTASEKENKLPSSVSLCMLPAEGVTQIKGGNSSLPGVSSHMDVSSRCGQVDKNSCHRLACMSSLCRYHADLPCIVPVLVCGQGFLIL